MGETSPDFSSGAPSQAAWEGQAVQASKCGREAELQGEGRIPHSRMVKKAHQNRVCPDFTDL